MSLSEEGKIRELIDTWLEASKAGDLETVRSLMTEDVVFLTRDGVMKRDDFVASFQSMAGNVEINGLPDIQEITVVGDVAVCWNKLRVEIRPRGGTPKVHAGDVLTVFRRGADGRWRLWRDANLLAAV